MSEFTPGPWKIQKPLNIHDVSVCEYEIVGSHETELRGKQQIKICGIHNSVTANANLIAAAPELYEALERIKSTGVFVGAIAQEMMDAAIKKARGE